MSNIEFRGKIVDGDGHFEYGDLIHKQDKTYIHFYDCNNFECMYEVIPETVGQYSGLKDKHGKKLFKDDVFKFVENTTGKNRLIHCKVVFDYYCFKYSPSKTPLEYIPYDSLSSIEVIGNIFDNPKLERYIDEHFIKDLE